MTRPIYTGHDFGLLVMPCHGPSLNTDHIGTATKIARTRHLHAIGPTEAYNRIPELSNRRLWDIIIGTSRTDKRRGAKDNPILVRKGRNHILESGAFKACRAARPRRIAPERWVTWVVLETDTGLPVLYINIHPNAGVQNANPLYRRVRGFFRQMRSVERLVYEKRAAHGDDLHVVISGDVNSTSAWDAKWSPASVFKRLGLKTYWHNILAVAYDPRLQLARSPEVVPTTDNGQDHPWFVVTFKEKHREPTR